MDAQRLLTLVDDLDDNIDDLEEALAPLLDKAFSATTKKLPVLDRAKLYVLVTYSIESLLFSYVRLHDLNAREHPVFTELTRVKQYFEKLKQAESVPSKRDNLSLNKEATGRVIKHALSGNDKYDVQRTERQAVEKARAKEMLKKLDEDKKSTVPQKRSAEQEEEVEVEQEADDNSEDSSDDGEIDEIISGLADENKDPATYRTAKRMRPKMSAAEKEGRAKRSERRKNKEKKKNKEKRKKNTQ